MTKPNAPFSKRPPEKRVLIRASELAHFGFCKRAWWLSTVKKVPAANLDHRQRGTHHHHDHARQVQAARRRQQIGLILLGGGSFLLLLVLGLWLW